MIKTVMRQYTGWTLEQIESLYVDEVDYRGLEFWYNDVKQQNEDLQKVRNKK